MGCLVALFALISPRLALILVWLFSDDLSRAFESFWIPLIGFFILPWTTLAYALMWVTGTPGVHGFEVFIVAFAFVVDIGSYVGGRRSNAQRGS
jgi:hypothetical protein